MTDDQKPIETHTHRMAGLLADIIAGAHPDDMAVLMREAEEAVDDWRAAAASLEAQEPDYWVARSGPHIEFGMRRPGPEDDGAIWCARTEVNQHINDRMCEQPGLVLHLEALYRHPPTSAAPVPDPDWKYDTALIFAAAHHLERVMGEHPYCDHVQVVKHYADIRREQKRSANPQPEPTSAVLETPTFDALMRDICEQAPADPEQDSTVCVDYDWLYSRVREAMLAAAPRQARSG